MQKLVDEKILPYVEFEKMTRLAVGRGWRQATPEQRAALTREFRTLLVRTYSGALSQVTDHQVQLKPFRANAEFGHFFVYFVNPFLSPLVGVNVMAITDVASAHQNDGSAFQKSVPDYVFIHAT